MRVIEPVITSLGDAHNFGRRVRLTASRIHKPRTVAWEWLLLSAASPLRVRFEEWARADGAADLFSFLPDLAFASPHARDGSDVERVALSPLGALDEPQARALAKSTGGAIALFAWLGVADLHWENLALGKDGDRIVFTPLDIEMILADMELPTETKLLPEADPEVAAICRHACGVRRILPYLGKPLSPEHLVTMAGEYRRMLAFLDRHAPEIAEVIAQMPHFDETPIRVLLRGTDEYVQADRASLWPPLLDEERAQLARGDIPYFFRLYGKAGIHYYANEALTEIGTLPLEGDVPQLEPLLRIKASLRSPSRARLREEGLFTVLGAFDHPSFAGRFTSGPLAVTFSKRNLMIAYGKGDELETSRKMSAFVGSVYLPCHCGEVESVFVPHVTTCDAPC